MTPHFLLYMKRDFKRDVWRVSKKVGIYMQRWSFVDKLAILESLF